MKKIMCCLLILLLLLPVGCRKVEKCTSGNNCSASNRYVDADGKEIDSCFETYVYEDEKRNVTCWYMICRGTVTINCLPNKSFKE